MARKYSAEEELELLKEDDEEETEFDNPQENGLEQCDFENGNKDKFPQKIKMKDSYIE